jgi:hypothetical protein
MTTASVHSRQQSIVFKIAVVMGCFTPTTIPKSLSRYYNNNPTAYSNVSQGDTLKISTCNLSAVLPCSSATNSPILRLRESGSMKDQQLKGYDGSLCGLRFTPH